MNKKTTPSKKNKNVKNIEIMNKKSNIINNNQVIDKNKNRVTQNDKIIQKKTIMNNQTNKQNIVYNHGVQFFFS